MKDISLKEKVIKGSFIVILFSLLGSVFAYFIRVLYSRSLSVENYGLFYAVVGFFALISSYTELGFGEAMNYFIPKHFHKKKYKDLLNTLIYGQTIQISIATLFSVVIALLAPFLSLNYFKTPDSLNMIYIFCILLILTAVLNSLLQIFTGLQKEKYYSSIYILRTGLVFLFSLLYLILGEGNILFYALSWVFGYLITSILFLYLLWSKHPFLNKNDLVWEKTIFKSMYKYALPAFMTTFIYSLITSSDIFFLTLFKGTKEVGIFSIIVPIASVSVVFLSPLNNILLPLISQLMEGDRKRINLLISKIYQLVPFVGVYFALFIVLFPSAIIGLIFGNKWLGLAESNLAFLALANITFLMSNILGIITLGLGKVRERLKLLFIMSLFNICINAILIMKYGILGAIITNSLITFILCIVFTKIIQKTIPFKIPLGYYLKLLIIILFIFFLVKIININISNWEILIVAGIIYTFIFVCLGYLTGVYDKKLIDLFIKKKID